jgi:hypothetical protein
MGREIESADTLLGMKKEQIEAIVSALIKASKIYLPWSVIPGANPAHEVWIGSRQQFVMLDGFDPNADQQRLNGWLEKLKW